MPTDQAHLPFGPVRNSGLFSNHWLEHRLWLEPEWIELRAQAQEVLDKLGDLWRQQRTRVEHYGNEAGLEQAFIQPVLQTLGWKLQYQTFLRNRKPDYALFLDDTAYDAALKTDHKSQDFWNHPTVVADAKAWHISLDRPRGTGTQREYPPEQIEWYLDRSRVNFGILTNGTLWRLFPRSLGLDQRRFETFLECDLPAILDQWTDVQRTIEHQQTAIDDFLRFYLFFSPAAFRPIAGRQALIRRAVEGSTEYRLGVGDGLKKRVFEALRLCIEGFLAHAGNALIRDRDLGLCREQSFTLLYRLLFILYAEDRRLLPYRVNNLYTNNRSLARHRDEIAGRLDRIADGREPDYDGAQAAIWGDLVSLFDLIDRGHKTYGVPAYNGGLFDPESHAFLAEKALSDRYIARVIDQLGRAPDTAHPDAPGSGLFRVDYRDLAIQHLGGIYEGLLEQRPHVAAEPMIVIDAGGRGAREERIVPEAAPLPAGFTPTGQRFQPGEVYLLNDKGERRSTGSYYTPNPIVDYIVTQTLGPLCQGISQALDAEIQATEAAYKAARNGRRQALAEDLARLRGDFDSRLLRLRILDPAMGSGHFLLRACQYLAEEIATNPHTVETGDAGGAAAGQPGGDEPTLVYWKRRVVERCLYGVDFNPMAVELAKLALWLETVSTSQPLTFLDHHLRHGNSLIGAQVADLDLLPGELALTAERFQQRVEQRLPVLLKPLQDIRALPSDTMDQVKEKDRLYRRAFEPVRRPFIDVADLWCSTFFAPKADQIGAQQYHAAFAAIDNVRARQELAKEPWLAKALGVAHRPDVAAFHWELEFPEVFFDLTGRNADGGFDAVIGNPPYDVLSEKETGHDLAALQNFIRSRREYAPSLRGKNNLYKLFVCRAVELLREGGRLGFITPMAILGDDQAAEIRKLILGRGAFTSIDAFPQKDDPTRRVFLEAKLSTVVFSIVKSKDSAIKAQAFSSRVHPANLIEDNSPQLALSTADLPLYDPANLTIVSCTQVDWDLATRIMRSGRMRRLGDFCTSYQGEVNETNDRKKGRISYNSSDGPEAMRGAHLCLYALRTASQGTPLYVVRERFLAGVGGDTKAMHHRHERVGFQRKAPQNNFRRLIAARIPRGTFLVESISYVPEHACLIPLDIVLAVLNSKLADWYFRLGSTNAMIGEYQFKVMPCPVFGEAEPVDRKMSDAAIAARRAGDLEGCFTLVKPGLEHPPFSPAVRELVVELVDRITQIEADRGEISRSDRSALDPAAQPYQDLIDRLLYAMAGLSEDEAQGLEDRLSRML